MFWQMVFNGFGFGVGAMIAVAAAIQLDDFIKYARNNGARRVTDWSAGMGTRFAAYRARKASERAVIAQARAAHAAATAAAAPVAQASSTVAPVTSHGENGGIGANSDLSGVRS